MAVRIVLYTGKGGVGKSTLSAASAIRSARRGDRTLLVSSDLAHNVADILDAPVGDRCVSVAENLDALEVDVLQEIEEHWDPIQEYLASFLAYLGTESLVAEEVAMIPGVDLIFLLTRILREIESGRYDTVVVDCAPTGGTLRLLSLTDTATTKFNALMNVERQIVKLIRPAGRQVAGLREIIPEDRFYGSLAAVVGHIGRLGEILRDPERSTVRLVLNPERVAIAETRRAYTYFALFGFPVDGIFVNKVFPDDLAQGYLGEWCALQRRHQRAIEESFLDTRILAIPHLRREPIGIEALDELGRSVFGGLAPGALLSRVRTARFARERGRTVLRFAFPGLDRSSLEVARRDDDLLIRAGGHSRVFMLPDGLRGAEVAGARYRDDQLVVTFTPPGRG